MKCPGEKHITGAFYGLNHRYILCFNKSGNIRKGRWHTVCKYVLTLCTIPKTY